MTPSAKNLCGFFDRIHQGATLTDLFPEAEPLLIQAYGVMLWAHIRQARKGPSGRPYSQHPLMVMTLVRLAGGTLSQQIAALLHDAVEDVSVNWPNTSAANMMQAIVAQFGHDVADMVLKLTNPEGLDKDHKDDWQYAQLHACPEIRLVKAADKICNAYDTIVDAPAGWPPAKLQKKKQAGALVTKTFPELPQLLHDAGAAFAAL